MRTSAKLRTPLDKRLARPLCIAVLLTSFVPDPVTAQVTPATAASSLRPEVAARALRDTWASFDKAAGKSTDMFGQQQTLTWYMQLTPPIPLHWPPDGSRGVIYYAYAEYQTFQMHGPSLSRSAPWARVVLRDGGTPEVMLLSPTIGPAVSGEGARPLTSDLARRLSDIHAQGEHALPSVANWTKLPDLDNSETRDIRTYFCQWTWDNRVSDYARAQSAEFFQWLACPQPSSDNRGIVPETYR